MRNCYRLSDVPMFSQLNSKTIEEIEKSGSYITRKKGDFCFRANTRQDKVYILMEGQVIWYTLTSEGIRKIIFVYGAGELLNQSIMNPEKTTISCELIRDSRIFTIDREKFLAIMKKDFELTKVVISTQEKKIWRMTHQLQNTLGSIYLEKKLAAKLWKLGRDFGIASETDKQEKADANSNNKASVISGSRVIDIQLSITFLADLLGAPRETTSRICKSLVKKGLININKKTVEIPRMECLASFYRNNCKVNGECDNCRNNCRE
ncbi:MAG: Crp/Fnr family transcriptional regulator [Eubacteriales bacterium]|nr:Crp/Fnr family transcriptional regulator [Eubacteriales bacterium]